MSTENIKLNEIWNTNIKLNEIWNTKSSDSDSENVTTNIHFFRQVHLVKPTSLRKEIRKDSSDGNDEYGCNGFPLKEIL